MTTITKITDTLRVKISFPYGQYQEGKLQIKKWYGWKTIACRQLEMGVPSSLVATLKRVAEQRGIPTIGRVLGRSGDFPPFLGRVRVKDFMLNGSEWSLSDEELRYNRPNIEKKVFTVPPNGYLSDEDLTEVLERTKIVKSWLDGIEPYRANAFWPQKDVKPPAHAIAVYESAESVYVPRFRSRRHIPINYKEMAKKAFESILNGYAK